MPDTNQVDRLWDWFDAVVILARPGPLSAAARQATAAFNSHRPVFIVEADTGVQACSAVQVGADNIWRIGVPHDSAGYIVAPLPAFLRARQVRRPLIWFDTFGLDGLDDVWPEAFTVFSAERELGTSAQNVVAEMLSDRFDIAVWPQAQSVDAALPSSTPIVVWGDQDGDAEAFVAAVKSALNALLAAQKTLNVLVLYDEEFSHIKAIQEHLAAFGRHSRFNYFYLSAADSLRLYDAYDCEWPAAWDFAQFDAIVWHFTLRAAFDWHISPVVMRQLAAYDGLKVLFIQDDYDNTQTTWSSIEAAGIHLVMTITPVDGVPYAFPDWRPGGVEFIRTLTGFVPEDDVERFAIPVEERELRLVYRGRSVPYNYGTLGRDKSQIGIRMKALAAERGVLSDIAVDDDSRIYGEDWYRFTASARATLATESGSHVYDFDGSLARAAAAAREAGQSYEDFHAEHLLGREDHIRGNQVSPRIFEAIRLRTALVCFEGEYSGVIRPDLHYIPLKKDFSNVDAVFAKLEDVEGLKAMTDRAYRDVIESGDWSYRRFVQGFDRILETRLLRQARAEIISAPILRRRRSEQDVTAIPRRGSLEYILATSALRAPFKRQAAADKLETNRATERGLAKYRVDQGLLPPAEPLTIQDLSPYALIVCPDGRSAPLERGVKIWLPDGERFAGYLTFDVSGLCFDHEYCWARLRFDNVSGDATVAACTLGSPDNMELATVPNGPGPTEVVLKVRPGHDNLLIHTGVSGIAGEAVLLSAQIITALAYEPGVTHALQTIARGTNHLGSRVLADMNQEPSAEIYRLARPQRPPGVAQVVPGGGGPDQLQSQGAVVDLESDGARLTTPAFAWSYAASFPLDLSAVRLEHEFCWIRLSVRDVVGDLRVCLWDRAANRLVEERVCPSSAGDHDVLLSVYDLSADCLLFRTGAHDNPAGALVREVAVVTAWSYPAAVVDIARSLGAPIKEPDLRRPPPTDVDADGAPSPTPGPVMPSAEQTRAARALKGMTARLRALFS